LAGGYPYSPRPASKAPRDDLEASETGTERTAVTIKTKHIAPPSHFKQAWREFFKLSGVNKDIRRQTTVDDLLFAARLELGIYEDGESHITTVQAEMIRRFIAKYGRGK